MTAAPLLSVRNLRLDIPTGSGVLRAVRGVDFALASGRTLGIVGESGSGKSLTALSLIGLHPGTSRRTADEIRLDGREIGGFSEAQLARDLRGKAVGMVFQEPMTSLNPVMSIAQQLTEVMTVHGLASERDARRQAVALLERVGITGAARRMSQYPHQFSGGQRQRIMIAMALMARPKLLIADEPTTALDVTVQAEILGLLAELRDEFGMGLILITHNLGVVSRVADDVMVMYAGEAVECAPAAQLFNHPRHPYTQGLLAAMPGGAVSAGGKLGAIPGVVPSLTAPIPGCAFAPRCVYVEDICRLQPPPVKTAPNGGAYRCIHDTLPPPRPEPGFAAAIPARSKQAAAIVLEAEGLEKGFRVKRGMFGKSMHLRAVSDASLAVRRGEVLAIVGESGSGKTTLGRLLLGLDTPDEGRVLINGQAIFAIPGKARARLIQPVFQDPRGSLNPRRPVGALIRRALDVHDVGQASSRDAIVRDLMEKTGLPKRLFHAYPGQLSGGQRQRVAIARALILNPEILLCDEPTSALDVSVQAQILNLLADLKSSLGLTLVLITHDLSVVEHMADRVAVMYLGRIVETGAARDIFQSPQHPYTRALIQSALPAQRGVGLPRARIGAGFASPMDASTGCVFAKRCPDALPKCAAEKPAEIKKPLQSGYVACHLFADNSQDGPEPSGGVIRSYGVEMA